MLTITNLTASKELDRAEMGAIKGGNSFFSNGVVLTVIAGSPGP